MYVSPHLDFGFGDPSLGMPDHTTVVRGSFAAFLGHERAASHALSIYQYWLVGCKHAIMLTASSASCPYFPKNIL